MRRDWRQQLNLDRAEEMDRRDAARHAEEVRLAQRSVWEQIEDLTDIEGVKAFLHQHSGLFRDP